jgi:hypothetical protein
VPMITAAVFAASEAARMRDEGDVGRELSCWSLAVQLPRFACCSGVSGLHLDYRPQSARNAASGSTRDAR